MPVKPVFAYEPIVNADGYPVAVELIACGAAGCDDSAQAVASMVLDAVVNAPPEELARQRLTYFRVPAALLGSTLLDQLPATLLVLEIASDDAVAQFARCAELRRTGYRLALAQAARNAEALPRLLPCFDVVRFDAKEALCSSGLQLAGDIKTASVRLLASGVDRQDTFAELQRAGFTHFQGYHFAHPTQLATPREDARKLAVLDLLSKLSSDADDPVIEEAFKADPALTLHLLRIVNSSAYALKTNIRSIKHAFTILGRRQLERWLQVLLFALDGDGAPSPLMELALRRARFMEFVLIYRTHKGSTVLQDIAYMAGLLSLVDVLLGWNMQDVVERLNLGDDMRDALVARSGALGQLLKLSETLEVADFDAALPIAEALHLPLEAVMTAQNVALAYSERIGQRAE